MKRHFKVWWQLAMMNFESQYGSGSRLNTLFLIVGKLVRLVFVLVFLVYLFSHTKNLAGYGLFQTLLFFMTFNLIDTLAQFFLRGIYLTRSLVGIGYLDGILLKPINPLFRLASHMIDFLDLLTLIPVIGVLVFVISHLESPVTLPGLILYLFLCLIGFVIALSIHILVAALAVATQEIDNEIWIYRDLMTMGRFPVDIYAYPIQLILTFVIPVAVMISFPAKALLGLLSPEWVVLSIVLGLTFFGLSVLTWRWSLRQYSSVGG